MAWTLWIGLRHERIVSLVALFEVVAPASEEYMQATRLTYMLRGRLG